MPVIQLELDSKGAVRSLQKFDNAVDATEKNTETSFGKMRKHVNSIGAAAMATGVVVATAFTFFSLKALNAASDMEETQGKFDVVFRNLGTYAEDAAKRISASYGMSNQESKLYLSSLQDLLVPSGLARDKAAEMSVAFTELAADLGSFNNVGTAQVVRDIQSALAGGSETMTKYGIDVKVAAVKAEMLALGLDTSTKAAERQSRTVALLSIMQRDSSDAMGDFARTTGSYANQLKIAKANVDNLWVALGKKLLPVATEVLKMFNEWITVEGRVNTIINFTIEAIRFVDNGIRGLILTAKGMAVGVAGAFNVVVQSIRMLLAPLDLAAELAKQFGLIDTNPLERLGDFADDFLEAQIAGFKETLSGIEKSNKMYDSMKEKVEEVVKKTKEQETIQKKVTDSVKETEKAVDGVGAAYDQLKTKAVDAANVSINAAKAVASSWQNASNTMGYSYGTAPDASSPNGGYVDPNSGGSLRSSSEGVVSIGSGGNSLSGSGPTILGAPPSTPGQAGAGSVVNININEKLSRSDVVAIVAESNRLETRA